MAVHPNKFPVPSFHLTLLNNQMASMPGDWFVVDAKPHLGEYALRMEVEPSRDGKPGRYAIANVTLDIDALLKDNAEHFNNSIGKRWGDGQRVASIPIGLRYGKNELRGLGDAADVGDMKYVEKILNDSEFRKFRTFGGRL